MTERLGLKVDGRLVEGEAERQAILALLSGLVKETGRIGFGMSCALPTGSWVTVEVVAPKETIDAAEPPAA